MHEPRRLMGALGWKGDLVLLCHDPFHTRQLRIQGPGLVICLGHCFQLERPMAELGGSSIFVCVTGLKI